MSIDKYLYEIIEDYKESNSEEEKLEVFSDFCSSLWSSKNKRRVYTKTIRFKVRDDLLDTEAGQIFNTWSEVEYKGYKARTTEDDWCSLIRQKINNLYTRYCDKEVILNKEYMDLLKTPKNLYFRWIKGFDINLDNITQDIEDAIYKAEELKVVYQKQKMELSWDYYKYEIEKFLKRAFDNCILIDDYERKYGVPDNYYLYEFAIEDNFYIKYFCNSLELYIRNYQKKYYGLSVPSTTKQNKEFKRCKECGALIEIKSKKDFSTKYCNDCRKKSRKEKRVKYNSNYYNKKIKNKAKSSYTTLN